MAHPTVNPRGTVIHGRSLTDASVAGGKLFADAVGLTGVADAIQRNVTVVPLANTAAKGFVTMVFRAPPSGAKLTACYITPGSIQNHSTTEADTWKFKVKKWPSGLSVSKNEPSLSNQTLAATSFKTIPLNAGQCTMLSGNCLSVSSSISGSPAALQWPAIVIEWTPLNNV